MAIEQMKYISIMGPVDMFNEFVLKYVINNNIQLESTYKTINTPGLMSFDEDTSFDSIRKRMRILNDKFGVEIRSCTRQEIECEFLENTDIKVIEEYVSSIEENFVNYRKRSEFNSCEIQQREQILKQILPLSELEIDIDEMFHFSFMKFRFGFLPKENYQKQKNYLEELDVVIVPISERGDTLWLSYFMPNSVAPVIDSVFAALGFERVRISDQVKGMPKITIERLYDEIENTKKLIKEEENDLEKFISQNREKFDLVYHKVLYYSKINEIKKMCSRSREAFFIVGWIPKKDFQRFTNEVEQIDRIICSAEDPDCVVNCSQPTIVKNNKFFKPFESLVSMYGIPSTKELDPTPFMAITYILMFGFMFGDVGQGVIIALLGFFLYKIKKLPLGGVMTYVGISSTLFGFVYGSVFGSEEFLKPLWHSPLHSKDSINTLLFGAVGYGAVIILITMVLNIINSIRMKKWGRLLFDKNGIAGLLFYGGFTAVVLVSLKAGKFVMTELALLVVVIIPSIMIFFKEPLENLIMKKDHIFPKQKGIFFVEAFFELFEAALSFLSGTASFARVGAFALNHAGLSLAVWTLYSMMQGFGGVVVVIIGNIITIGLEGLIVGIQCMRLEYYEIFGRFYTGDGYEFKPVTVTED